MRRSSRNLKGNKHKCANCNEISLNTKKFLFTDQLTKNAYGDSSTQCTTTDSDDVEIKIEEGEGSTVFDALFEIFSEQWRSRRAFLQKAMNSTELFVCSDCYSALASLYKWFRIFTSKTKNCSSSFLFSLIYESSSTSSVKAAKRRKLLMTEAEAEEVQTSELSQGMEIKDEDDEAMNPSEMDFVPDENDYGDSDFEYKEEPEEDSSDETVAKIKNKNIRKFQRCDKCNVEFPTNYKYQRHLKSLRHKAIAGKLKEKDDNDENASGAENDQQKPKCEICGLDFPYQFNLNRHLKTKQHIDNARVAQSSDGEQSLKVLRKKLAVKRLVRSARMKEKFYAAASFDCNPLSCVECDKVCSTTDELLSHVKEEHPRDLECSYCTNKFTDKRHLRTHMNSVHDELKNHLCVTCGKRFFSKGDLNAHLRYHFDDVDVTCLVCNAQFTSEVTLKTHMLSHVDNGKPLPAFSCSECGKRFTKNEQLLTHVSRIHEHRNKYPCTYTGCSKSFATPSLLKSHTNSHYDPTHLCNDCGKLFKHKTHLIIHQRRLHGENEKTHGCTVCDFKFHTSYNLRQHIVKKGHYPEGNEPKVEPAQEVPLEAIPTQFLCGLCNVEFKSETNLKVHMFTHENSDSSLSFSCDICGKMFVSQLKLERHMLHIHKGTHVCDTCGKRFHKPSALQKHSVTHMDVHSFFCSICQKGYKYKADMVQHIKRIHSSTRSTCEICGKDFSNTGSLRIHKVTQHPNAPGLPLITTRIETTTVVV